MIEVPLVAFIALCVVVGWICFVFLQTQNELMKKLEEERQENRRLLVETAEGHRRYREARNAFLQFANVLPSEWVDAFIAEFEDEEDPEE